MRADDLATAGVVESVDTEDLKSSAARHAGSSPAPGIPTAIRSEPRFLLLQVRKPDDRMLDHEVECFVNALGIHETGLTCWDLIAGPPPAGELARADAVLIGGSGDFSVVRGGTWLEPALDTMRGLHDRSVPTFASCWGFQALAKALGGEVVTDHSRAEIGAVELTLTEAGRRDPLFGAIGDSFPVLIGHEDIVESLPPGAVLLGSTATVVNQAFRFPGRPIYATQFHPELDRAGIVKRISQYAETYLPLTGTATIEEFRDSLPDVRGAASLLRRFREKLL